MKITKSQLDRLIRVAVLDILKELEMKAREAGLEGGEEVSPDEPPVHMGEGVLTEKKAKLGSGARFKSVERSAAKSGASDPAAVAAAAGRAKYGQKKMTALSQKGKRDEK